jgi:hypothetical protein
MRAGRSVGPIEDYPVLTGTNSIDQENYSLNRGPRGAPARYL